MKKDKHHLSAEPATPKRDRAVLTLLVLISAYLVFDSLYHQFFPTGHVVGEPLFVIQHATGLWVLPVMLQLLCILYIWRRFRTESGLRGKLSLALEQREDEMTKFQNIIESTPSRISIQSPAYKILYQNPAHAQIIGSHAGEFCYEAYCGSAQVCDPCPLQQTFADGQIHSLRKMNLINGEPRYLELVTSPLKKADGTIVAGIEVVKDNTEQVLRERHIRELSDRLEENNRELRAFGSALAHDLRQPLTRTYMAAQVLEEQSAGQAAQNSALLDAVLKGCEQMEELLEGMLALSRVDNEELNREQVELLPLIDEVMLDLQALEPNRRFSIEKPDSCRVVADRKMLRILLANLLGNSWRYTRESELAEFKINCVAKEGEWEITVSDNGIGFSMSEAGDLFRPFTRLHPKQGYPGVGIGLATARRVVHRHGGRIWAESRPGDGAQFHFTLPFTERARGPIR